MKRIDKRPIGYRCRDCGTVWTRFDGGTTPPVYCSNCYSGNVSEITTLCGLPKRIRMQVHHRLERLAAAMSEQQA